MLYKDFAPSTFDCRGLALPDRQDWLVGPCFQDRDSGPLAESNFASFVRALGGESDTVEVHRFGHWANGWFELVLVHPSRADELAELEGALADYPVLDDHDLCVREQEAAYEAWQCWAHRDFARLAKFGMGLSDAAYYLLLSNADATWAFHADHADHAYEWNGGDVSFPMRYLDDHELRGAMATLLRSIRRAA